MYGAKKLIADDIAKASISHGSHLIWCSFNLKLKNPPTRRFSPLWINIVANKPLLTTEGIHFDNALKVASLLEDTRFADIGIIFMAEIFEKSLLNPEKAKNFYMRILDEYPSSIYAEPVRYHIRELQNITNSWKDITL